jgi:hypothetical protein
MEIPSYKHQISNKHQCRHSNDRKPLLVGVWELELGRWNLFEICIFPPEADAPLAQIFGASFLELI